MRLSWFIKFQRRNVIRIRFHLLFQVFSRNNKIKKSKEKSLLILQAIMHIRLVGSKLKRVVFSILPEVMRTRYKRL
jgi:hypothetical protein